MRTTLGIFCLCVLIVVGTEWLVRAAKWAFNIPPSVEIYCLVGFLLLAAAAASTAASK